MKLYEINSHKFGFEGNIQAVGLLHGKDILVLNEAGDVVLYHKDEDKEKILFGVVPKSVYYPDGGFVSTEKSSIHVMDDMFIVSNDYKTHSIFCDLNKGYSIRIQRTDYYAKFSKYPIGFFKRDGVIHLIYSTLWNRVDIANVETRQVLTIGKSLAEEGAEQEYLKTHKEENKYDNKLLWPRNFDYFYGDIKISPDGKKFLSAGWMWGSFGRCKVFDIDSFINDTRISSINIMDSEHDGISFCFVDNDTIGTVFNPYKEDEDDRENRYQIRLYACSGEGKTGVIKPDNDYDLNGANIFRSTKLNVYFLFSDKLGLLVIDDAGKTMLYEPDTKIAHYDEASGLFLEIKHNEVIIKNIEMVGNDN